MLPVTRLPLTAAAISATATAMADAGGIDGVSMRKLAAALGVTPMSLYNHVAGRDALIDLMLDGIVAQIETPEPGAPWKAAMRARARSMRRALLRHPWAPAPLMARLSVSAVTLRDADRTTGCLVAAGFGYPQADWARNALDSHVYGYTIQEAAYPVAPEDYRAAAAEYLPMIPEETYPHVYAAARQIIDGTYDGRIDVDFGLDLILDGLERWLAADG